VIFSNPIQVISYFQFQINRKKYFGNRAFYNEKILRHSYKDFAQDLPVFFVDDINAKVVVDLVKSINPKLIYVFGTRLIKPELLSMQEINFVNLHWGWSPDYRAEGIVSALALEGPCALGVTIHLLNELVDGGDIIYQGRPLVENTDNFYSVGLKLTVLGIELLNRVSDDFDALGSLIGERQDFAKGRVFTSGYMRTHPYLYQIAWKRLKSIQSPLI
jgi:methionyl-tRNA formyltransferase